MSGFYFGEWKADLIYKPEYLNDLLYLSTRTQAGIEFLTANGERKLVKPGETIKDDLYFAMLEPEQLQAIAEAFANKGVKAGDTHRLEGLLEATKYHLEDMRRIAFEPPIEVQRVVGNVSPPIKLKKEG